MSTIGRNLTGRVRLVERRRWFRKPLLVVRVEVTRTKRYMTPDIGGPMPETYEEVKWEDAMFSDFPTTMMKMAKRLDVYGLGKGLEKIMNEPNPLLDDLETKEHDVWG